jgi:hypothetical protein
MFKDISEMPTGSGPFTGWYAYAVERQHSHECDCEPGRHFMVRLVIDGRCGDISCESREQAAAIYKRLLGS